MRLFVGGYGGVIVVDEINNWKERVRYVNDKRNPLETCKKELFFYFFFYRVQFGTRLQIWSPS